MKEERGYGWLDCMTERLMTEDTAYVAAFIDHMPVPKKQREQLRARVIDELKARDAMAR